MISTCCRANSLRIELNLFSLIFMDLFYKFLQNGLPLTFCGAHDTGRRYQDLRICDYDPLLMIKCDDNLTTLPIFTMILIKFYVTISEFLNLVLGWGLFTCRTV